MTFDRERAEKATGFIERLKVSTGRGVVPFTLIPWQRDIVERVFGTIRDDGLRQYRLVYVEITKKQGKSALASGLALKGLFADGEYNPQVYCAAVDKSQASIVFDEAVQMIKRSPTLKNRCIIRESTKTIVVPKTNGKYQALSADIDSKHGINPSVILFDEIHAAKSRKLWDVLTKNSTDAREQPLIIVITTAGEAKEGVGWELHERAVAKLEAMKGLAPGDPEPDPSFLPIIYGATEEDDWESEETWIKANPSIGYTVKLETVREAYSDAKGKPIDEALFKQLRLNMWGTPVVDRWIPVEVWDRTKDIPVNEEALKGRTCYGGLDLSEQHDLTGWVMVFPRDDDPEYLEVVARLFIPEARLTDSRNPYRALYAEWKRKGHLIVTPGDVIDYRTVKETILKDNQTFNIVDFNYDRLFQSSQIAQELWYEGMTAVPFNQSFGSYAVPMYEFERRVYEGKILHGGNAVLRWMFDNLDVERDANNNKKPTKRNKHKKIDGIVALIMALDSAHRHQTTNGTRNQQIISG